MKKILFVCLVFLLGSLNIKAQNIDTLMYPLAKATNYAAVTCNVPSEFNGYAQYFDAPQTVIVRGFRIYAGVNSANVLDTALVTASLFIANPDSTPGVVARQKEFTIYNTYSANIDDMQYEVLFDTPDTVSSSFLVGIETQTTQPLGIMTDDYNAGDGGMEELGFWHWSVDSTWYRSNEFFVWDVDYLILPIIEYLPVSLISGSGIACQGDTTCIQYSPSAFLTHRMYNETAFNNESPLDSTTFDWGDGVITSFPDTCHSYSGSGNFDLRCIEELGWGVTLSLEDTLSFLVNESYASTDVVSSCGDYTWPVNSVTYTADTNLTVTLTTINTGCDSVLTLDLTILPALTGVHNETVCDGGSIVVNGTTYDAGNLTGTEVFTNIGPNNCDSTVTVTLTIEPAIDATVDNTLMPILTANQTGATYQWVDCDNGNAPIPLATSQNYTATLNGNYAVEVTVGSCMVTSGCEAVTGVGIRETSSSVVSIYPNPTSGLFTISLTNTKETVSYMVSTLEGRIVKQASNVTLNNIEVDLTDESKGVYFLRITEGNSNNTYKIVKQ